jgi:hypothetical protein
MALIDKTFFFLTFVSLFSNKTVTNTPKHKILEIIFIFTLHHKTFSNKKQKILSKKH